MFGSRRGAVMEGMLYLVVGLVVSIVIIFTLLIVQGLNTKFQAMGDDVVVPEAKAASSLYTAKMNGWDIGYLVFWVGAFIALIVLGRLLDTVRVWYVLYGVVALVILGFLGMILENLFDGFSQSSGLSDAFSGLRFIPFINDHLVIVILVCVTAFVIARVTRDDGVLQ